MERILSIIRSDAIDDRPDMWVEDRIELGLKSAMRSASGGRPEEAVAQTESVVRLLEETMKITDKVLLPTSCRFLDGMEWEANEDWQTVCNDPDAPETRMIFIRTYLNGVTTCYCLFPGNVLTALQKKEFDPVRSHPEFEKLCARVKALIVTRPKEQ